MKILILLILFTNNVMAASFYEDRSRGWYYFESKSKPKKQRVITDHSEYRELIEGAAAKAMMNPTPENVIRFKRLEHQLLAKAIKFAEVTKSVMRQNPDLSGAIENPISRTGLDLKYSRLAQHMENTLKYAAKGFGLILHMDDGEIGTELEKVVRRFAAKYNYSLAVVGPSEKSAIDFKLKALPAIGMYSPKKNIATVIAYGFVAEGQIKNNIRDIITELKHSGEL